MDDLQQLVAEYARRLDHRSLILTLQIPTQTIDAFRRQYPKIYLPFPAFSVGIALWGNALGLIAAEKEFLSNFDMGETEFILAHETAHIIKNHSVIALILEILGKEIKKMVKKNTQHYEAIEFLWNLIFILTKGTTFNGLVIKNQEKEADLLAVQLTNDRPKAISALEKLARLYANGNLDAPSHVTFIENGAIPAITFRERIQTINAYFPSISSPG